MGTMHAPSLAGSPILRRVLAVLADEAEHTTLEIQNAAQCCNPATWVSALRVNGFAVECRQERRRWWYRLNARLDRQEEAR